MLAANTQKTLVGFCTRFYTADDGTPVADVFIPSSGITAVACRVALIGRRINAPPVQLSPSEIQRRLEVSPSDFPEVVITNVGGNRPWVVTALLDAPKAPPISEAEKMQVFAEISSGQPPAGEVASKQPTQMEIVDGAKANPIAAMEHESASYMGTAPSLLDDVISTNGGARAAVSSDGRLYVVTAKGIDMQVLNGASVQIGESLPDDAAVLARPLGEQLKVMEAKINEQASLIAQLVTRVNEMSAFLSVATVNPLTQQLMTQAGVFASANIGFNVAPLNVDVDIIRSSVLKLSS